MNGTIQTIAVTGANGFLGSHVVRALSRRGYRVRALIRPGASTRFIESCGADIREISYFDPSELKKALQGVDLVVHNAALASDWGPYERFRASNLSLTERVFGILPQVGVLRAIHISSNAVLGEEDQPRPKNEYAPYRPRLPYFLERLLPSSMNYYRVTKALGEQAAIRLSQTNGTRLTVLRPVWIFGPREFHSGPYEYCETVLSRIPFFPQGRRNLFHTVYVGDVANAVADLVSMDRAGIQILNFGPPRPVRMIEFFGLFCRALGIRQPVPVPKWLLFPFAVALEFAGILFSFREPPVLTRARLHMFFANNVYDTRKAYSLGLKADTPLPKAVRITVRWWRMNGFLR